MAQFLKLMHIRYVILLLNTDGIVSHVCAVNLFDGNTPLHRTIEGGDYVDIVTALIEADAAVINVQNDAGLTPIHVACRLGRKKIIEKLLVGNEHSEMKKQLFPHFMSSSNRNFLHSDDDIFVQIIIICITLILV